MTAIAEIRRARIGPTRARPGQQWTGIIETGPTYRRRDTAASGLAPEYAGGVAVDLVEQGVDAVRRREQVVDVESEVAVAPVQGPGLAGGGVAQARDREAGPFRPGVLAPGSAPLDDREVSRGDLALDADLVAGVFGHPHGAPLLHSCDV